MATRARPDAPVDGEVKHAAGQNGLSLSSFRSAAFSRLGRATLGSLTASLASQGATAVSGIIAARMLGVENRGYLALIVLWQAILPRIAGLGLPLSLPFFISVSPNAVRAIVRLVLRPLLLQAVVVSMAQAVIFLLLLRGKPASVQQAGFIILAMAPLSLFGEYALAVLQGQQRFRAFNVIRSGPATLYALLVLLLFITNDHQIVAVASALVLASAASVVAAVLVAGQGIKANARERAVVEEDAPYSLKQLLRFGMKGLLGSVSPIETFRLDQAAVGLFLTPAALGLYVVAIAFTNLPRFIAQSVGFVAYPYIAGERKHGWSSMWPFMLFTVGSSALVIVPLMLTASLIVPWLFGAQFAGAAVLTRVLLLGALFFAARRVLTDASRGLGRPLAGSLAEVGSWAWLAISMTVLLPWIGVMGAAISLTTAAAFSLVVLCLMLTLGPTPSPIRQVEPTAVLPT